MGLIPVSQLQQAPPALRNAVLNKGPGTVNVASAGNGAFTIVLVVAREAAGQRDLATPGVKDQITNTLKSRKEGAAARGLSDGAAHRRRDREPPGASRRPGQGHAAVHLAAPV